MKKSAKIIYSGPSMLDGSPIVAICTTGSGNTKTGNMFQLYILAADKERSPLDINRLGLDTGICGSCPLKGIPAPHKTKGTAEKRPCYVVLFQGPLIVWKGWKAGKYEGITPAELPEFGAGETIRLGAYGDPAAIPPAIIRALISKAAGYTGYSHQWDLIGSDNRPALASYTMISADNITEARRHWKEGRRTFRVIKDITELDKTAEIICPATEEGGKRTTCADCKLCSGSAIKAKNIAAVAHGNGSKYIAGPRQVNDANPRQVNDANALMIKALGTYIDNQAAAGRRKNPEGAAV